MTGRNQESDRLTDLARAVHRKNRADARVARLMARQALPGPFGEFVAAMVFGIGLCRAANQKAFDGMFRGDALDGKTVNIKYKTRHDRLLNMKKEGEAGPDFYLVMTGPKKKAKPPLGETRLWVIESVFLFDAAALVSELRKRNPRKKIGVATGVPVDLWKKAMIYPNGVSPLLKVTDDQRDRLALFSATAVG